MIVYVSYMTERGAEFTRTFTDCQISNGDQKNILNL